MYIYVYTYVYIYIYIYILRTYVYEVTFLLGKDFVVYLVYAEHWVVL